MRIYQWEEVAAHQAEVERQLLHRELVKSTLEANGEGGPAPLSGILANMVQALFSGLSESFAYGAGSAKNCCKAEKRASAACC